MQVLGQPNVAAVSAGYSMPNAVPAKTVAAQAEQPLPEDQVTLSTAAREISDNVGNAPAEPTNVAQTAQKSVDSGIYSVIGSELDGYIIELLVD